MSQHVTKSNQLIVIFLLLIIEIKLCKHMIHVLDLEEVEFFGAPLNYLHLGLQH
jgi:hypothetical protein